MKTIPSLIEWAVKILVLALVYALSGRLALLLALPPGVATSIFPPAGIAMAGILIWGYRVWPSILLGSMALNSFSDDRTFDPSQKAFLIGVFSTLQAILGAWLIRRFVGFPLLLNDAISIGKFVLLSGPVACLTSATGSITALWLIGFLRDDIASNWFTWWVGDTIGVLVFLPLMLILLGQPRDVWQRRWLSVGLPLMLAFSSIVSIFYFVEEKQKINNQLVFNQQINSVENGVIQRIDSYLEVVHSITMLYQSSNNVQREEFKVFVDGSFTRHPGILALSWIPKVKKEDILDFKNAVHQDAKLEMDLHIRQGLMEFTYKKWQHNGIWEPYILDEPNELFPVYYIEPYRNNEAALGIDLASNPKRNTALKYARDSGQPTITEPITLAQETEEQFGFLFIIPIYAKGKPHGTIDQRRENLTGFVTGVFRMSDIIKESLEKSNLNQVSLDIIDDTDPFADQQFLFKHSLHELEAELTPDQVRLQRKIPYQIGGRKWMFQFTPHKNHPSLDRNKETWFVLSAASMLMITVSGSFLLLAGRAESTLRESEQKFRSMFQLAAVGITQVAPNGKFLRVNQQLSIILGYSQEELLSKTIQEVTYTDDLELDIDFVQSALNGELTSFSMEKRFSCKNQSVLWTNLAATLVRDESGRPKYFVYIIEDIGARRQAEEQIRTEQILLQKLIDIQETERRIIALDIHDGFTQDVIGAHLHIQGLRNDLHSDQFDAQFEFIDSLLSKAIKDCRRMIRDLRPMILDEAGVIEAIEHLVYDENKHLNFSVTFIHAVQFDRLEPKLESAIFRIVQEAINNVRRHGKTEHATVELKQTDDIILIEIIDHGVGFDPTQISQDSFGLRGIRVRARLFGGDVQIESELTKGTIIRVNMPVLSDS